MAGNVAEWEQYLTLLDAETIAGLERPELGPLSLGNASVLVGNCVRVASAIAVGGFSLVPATLQDGGRDSLGRLSEIKTELAAFDAQADTAPTTRRLLTDRAAVEWEWFREKLVPYLGAAERSLGETIGLGETVSAARGQATEIEQILASARARASDAAIDDMSAYYRGQAERHSRWSYAFLVGGAVVTVTAVALGLVLLSDKIEADPSTQSGLLEYLRFAGPRVFVVGVLLYVMRFLLRNFAVNRHLQVVNEQKRNALDTYPLLVRGLADDARQQVMIEVVRAVVSSNETGFLGDGPDKTIIESASGIPWPPR